MSRGVLYFNRGTGCLLRMLVSIQSLRRHWSGDITVAHEGQLLEWFKSIAIGMRVKFLPLSLSPDHILVAKSALWRISPFQHTLFLDADTVVLGSLDEAWRGIEDKGCVVTRFNDWHTDRGRMRRRIEAWSKIAPQEVEATRAYKWAVNTGVIGFEREIPLMAQYEAMTRKGAAAGGVARKTLDEIAMQLVLPGKPHVLLGQEWNISPVHGTIEGGKIIHYHGHKHCRDGANYDVWKNEFRLLVTKHPEFRKKLMEENQDPSVLRWLAEEKGIRKDVTIVSAVNPEYAARARKNVEAWLKLPGLAGNKFLFFVNGFKNPRDRAFLNHPNIKVVRWEYPHQCTTRETMLAAFVIGVARHVRTPYWMKLDVDAAPAKASWDWPDYRNHAITSHRWGYTKMKGDAEANCHWFTRLDLFFSRGNPLFKRAFATAPGSTVSHRAGNPDGLPMRFASFCHIEKTDFTKRMALRINDDNRGRMPIPSHDTMAWYCATLWKEKIKLMNMKEWFHP